MKSKISIHLVSAMGLLFLSLDGSTAGVRPTGYCLECHSTQWMEGARLWDRVEGQSVYQSKLEPCPAVRSFAEESYFTEKRIVQIHQILDQMEKEDWNLAGLRKIAAEQAFAFSQRRESLPISGAPFAQEAFSIRSSLQKVYDQTTQLRDEGDRRWLIGLGGLGLILLLLLLWMAMEKPKRWGGKAVIWILIGLAAAMNLNACATRDGTESSMKSPGQEHVDAALSMASRASNRMEEGFSQAVLLAEMAREWTKMEGAAAEKGFELAWNLAWASQKKKELFQRSEALLARWKDEDAARKEGVNWDSVLDLRDELRRMDSRTWALRAVAEQWLQVNGPKGRAALEKATQEAQSIKDLEIRDQELYAIAQAWSPWDGQRAIEIARRIENPYLKALALLDGTWQGKGKFSPDQTLGILEEAWQVAEKIFEPYPRIQALLKIAYLGSQIFPEKRESWAGRAMAEVKKVQPPLLQAMAQQEMVARWASLDPISAEQWAAGIPLHFPLARAYAFLHLSRGTGLSREKAAVLLKGALAEARKVDEGFEAQRIRFLVVREFLRLDFREASRGLLEMKDPYFRSKILGEMAELFAKTDISEGLRWAEKIPLELMRQEVIAKLILKKLERDQRKIIAWHDDAFQEISQIPDPYQAIPLMIDLAKSWESVDKGKGTWVLDWGIKAADRVSSKDLKDEVLEMLAAAYHDLDRGKAQALRNRLDPLATRSQRVLEEISILAKAEPERAYQMAQTFPAEFRERKAMALKEAAAALRASQPEAAYEALASAIELILGLPETPKRSKSLSLWITEAANLNPEKTFGIVRRISDWTLRDSLFKEIGFSLAKKNPRMALKVALEIRESSTRSLLYQRLADQERSRTLAESSKELPPFFRPWGEGRNLAKKEETQAIPYYEKALVGIRSVADEWEKANLLCALIVDWSLVDEMQALKLVDEIPSHNAEARSYALLALGAQFAKWNRQEGQKVLEKSLSEGGLIQDPSMKAKRMVQLARQFYSLDPQRGKDILRKALLEAQRGSGSSPTPGPVVSEILYTQILWGEKPGPWEGGSQFWKAQALLQGVKHYTKIFIEENFKPLEKAWQVAQGSKNPFLMAKVAIPWLEIDPAKGLELLAQVDGKELKIAALREAGRRQRLLKRPEAASRWLQLAAEEALKLELPTVQIQALRKIAQEWKEIDPERAKAIYRQGYAKMEQAFLPKPQGNSKL